MKDVLITSSVLILVLLALRQVFRKTISRRVQYALWGLVLVRLLVPVSLPAVEHNVGGACAAGRLPGGGTADSIRPAHRTGGPAGGKPAKSRASTRLRNGRHLYGDHGGERGRGNRHSLRRLDDRSGAAPVCLAGRHCCDGTVFPGDQPAVLAKTL